MITENLGKISITPKGQWVAGSYERLDLVTNAGSSYLSLKDENSSILTVTADWMLVAEKGDAFEYADFTPEQLAGLKGEAFEYADFTPAQIAELQQPAADAIASIVAVELAVEQAEALRVQAEIYRETNTGTAIQNAETATGQANDAAALANSKATLANDAATNANTKAGLANDAATLANTKAGLADTAATNADNARLAIQTDLGLKLDKSAVKQVLGASTTDVMSQKAVTDNLAVKEATANKQNSLATDGTGTKFPTVDAVNAGLAGVSSLRALFVARGAVYNSSTGFYELNGLTDITEAQMANIYSYTSQSVFQFVQDEMLVNSPIRTTYNRPFNGALGGTSMRFAFVGSQIEVYKCSLMVSLANSCFQNCTSLHTVDYINVSSITNAVSMVNMFANCPALVTCNLKVVKANISFAWSPLLSLASLQYLIQYRANGTTPITITVHPTVFAKLTDNTNYPTWYAVNQDALTKYITFASA